MIFLKRELPGQPPKRQTGIEKNGEKPDETFRQKDGERDYILNLVLSEELDLTVTGVERPFYFLRLVEIT